MALWLSNFLTMTYSKAFYNPVKICIYTLKHISKLVLTLNRCDALIVLVCTIPFLKNAGDKVTRDKNA